MRAAVGVRLAMKVVLAAVVLLRAKAPCGGERERREVKWGRGRRGGSIEREARERKQIHEMLTDE